MASLERFLVTGAGGCIGAWTVRQLIMEGAVVVAFDSKPDDRRLRLVMSEEERDQVTWVRGDVTSVEEVARVVGERAIQAMIHLAALQVPFCRENPPLGARVNVEGTVNVFEAMRGGDRQAPVVYASSIAAHDDSTLYGVYKRANEGTAAVYLADHGVASIGLRPHTVFGPGRDQGVTSEPTTAMLAAAAGHGYEIGFGGSVAMQYAADVAALFVAAARSGYDGATVQDLHGDVVTVSEIVAAIEQAAPGAAGQITHVERALPFPAQADGTALEAIIGAVPRTPFADGVSESLTRFRDLLDRGLVKPPSSG